MFRRVFWIVLDGVGIGALPDAAAYGDAGADTLGHVIAARGLEAPALAGLGLARLARLPEPAGGVRGAWGRLVERSPGKDTTTGHWELAGLVLDRPFPVYPRGFPPEVLRPFEEAIGRPVLGNVAASGTEIIRLLGDEHAATGRPIVYTSADSVFQIACHESVVPPERLYDWCRIARGILAGPHAVSRVIARPFEGPSGAYVRTERRRDFSVPPPGDTLLDLLAARGLDVVGVGKIEDIFAGRGLTSARHTGNNAEGTAELLRLAGEDFRGLCFANLVDFDMLYGHRRDAEGFGRALEAFDRALPALLARLRPGDLLVLTSDHGNDPLHAGSDHTRESVPLLAWAP
ncbi:MAG: phosphopentomutase, partial [Planctomycetes bacterium]|nr:phosphopentomutase [Planctomycetota bacterium]